MLIFFIGAPGSGKTTLINKFADFPRTLTVNTGRILRKAAEGEDRKARDVEQAMASGGLLPSALVERVLQDYLRQHREEAILIGGYPRREDQIPGCFDLAREINQQVGGLLVLDIPQEVAIERISGRRVCPECGAVYHMQYNPPRQDESCDECGAGLEQRPDDAPEAVKERFQHYRSETKPVYDAFHQQHAQISYKIDADASPEEVFQRAFQVLNIIAPEIFNPARKGN
jgi:adenylate kinase